MGVLPTALHRAVNPSRQKRNKIKKTAALADGCMAFGVCERGRGRKKSTQTANIIQKRSLSAALNQSARADSKDAGMAFKKRNLMFSRENIPSIEAEIKKRRRKEELDKEIADLRARIGELDAWANPMAYEGRDSFSHPERVEAARRSKDLQARLNKLTHERMELGDENEADGGRNARNEQTRFTSS